MYGAQASKFSRKRKASSYKRSAKRFRPAFPKSSPWGYGPVGGTSRGRGQNLTQVVMRQHTVTADRTFVKLSLPILGQFATDTAGAFKEYHVFPNCGTTTAGGTLGSVAWNGFSKWCSSTALYRAYTIHAFAYDIKVLSSTTGAASDVVAIGIGTQPTSMTAPSTWSQLINIPQSKRCLLQWGGGQQRMRGFLRVGQVYGQTAQTVAVDDTFSALYNADPTSSIKMYIGAQCVSSATTMDFILDIKLTAYIEFYGVNLQS